MSAVSNAQSVNPISPSLGATIDLEPKVKIGEPFDRDGKRWNPVFIEVGPEAVQLEACFAFMEGIDLNKIPEEYKKPVVRRLEEVGSLGAVYIGNATLFYQNITYIPFLMSSGKNNEIPESISDFKKYLTNKMHLEEAGTDLTEIYNEHFLVVQGCIKPTFSEKTVKEGNTTTTTTTKSTTGCFFKAYLSKHAIYILGDQSYKEELSACTETFCSSLKLIRS